ncbi:HipA family kinase [Gottfriedia luciferensis]|uniref:HipA family kinase n=1 Tax=Gottfriedia luciferensis TaxID=178774 RepID=UPI000B43DF4C|nr:HipA family kinase [Gottfriedia luciferensis]
MIEPVSYIKKLEGKSNAHLITFSDGRDYVVKYFRSGFEKTLPNEWIAYCIARFLDLPVPYALIVQIPEEFSKAIPEVELDEIKNSKFQFASLYVPETLSGHQVSSVSCIVNHETLAGIILFDYWLCNGDRTRKNILLLEEELNRFKLWIIDHAEAFGSYSWLVSELETLPQKIMKSSTHLFMSQFIMSEEEFNEQLEIIQRIPVLLLEEIVELIPDDWLVSKEDKKAIVGRLVNRRKKILPYLKHKFVKSIYRPLHQKNE